MTKKEEALKRKLLRRYEHGRKELAKLRSQLLPDDSYPEMTKLRELLLKHFEELTNILKENAQSIK